MSRSQHSMSDHLRRRTLRPISATDPGQQPVYEATPVTRKNRSSQRIQVPSVMKGAANAKDDKKTQLGDNDENINPEEDSFVPEIPKNLAVSQKTEVTYTSPVLNLAAKIMQSGSKTRSPLTPINNIVRSVRDRLEQRVGDSAGTGKVSPGLARLRSTPGRSVKEKQAVLSRKHQFAKNQSDSLSIGGGVTVWPDMDNMRLTASEVLYLILTCKALLISTVYLFFQLHGETHVALGKHYNELKVFVKENTKLQFSTTNSSFKKSVLEWHAGMQQRMEGIHQDFDVSIVKTCWSYQFCVVLYTGGIGTLLYFLYENIFARSKLTPRRTKIWVCLLTVLSTWTLLLMVLLVQAQALEKAVETAIHEFSNQLADLVHRDLDLAIFHSVMSYWATCCLPPQTQGTLHIMGILAVQDVAYYLQYYSLPVITALVTPIFKLVVALKEVYCIKTV